MIRRILTLAVMIGLVTAFSAGQVSQAQKSVDIRAGIVITRSYSGQNFNPYVWYLLDLNRRSKPAGWNFYNPAAPTRVTPAVNARWPGLALNAPVTKRDAPYWELDLDGASDSQMASFDVLHLGIGRAFSLNSNEREKLRRFMENGGVLWVEAYGDASPMDLVNAMPIAFSVSTANIGGVPNLVADYTHPILNFPNQIGADQLRTMQEDRIAPAARGITYADLAAAGYGGLVPIQSPLVADSFRLSPIAEDPGGAFIAVGSVGDGHMVVTIRGIANAISGSTAVNANNSGFGGGPYVPNIGVTSAKEFYRRSGDAACNLAVNIVNLASGFNQSSKGSHRQNSSPIDLGAPLLKSFFGSLVLAPGNLNYVPPAVYKGLVFVVNDNRIFAFDSRPSQDLNGDGNPDDGIQDFVFGANEDLVWSSQALPGPISAPIVVEVPSAGGTVNQLAVVDFSGNLRIFNALPNTPALNMAPVATIAPPANFTPFDTSLTGRGPYSATYHDGLYFVVDETPSGFTNNGRVWVASADSLAKVTSANDWLVGGPTNPIFQRASGSATVGYIPIYDNSGGLDRVLYIPTRPGPPGGPTAGMISIWLGARGEKPVSFGQSGTLLNVQTRANLQGLDVYLPPASPSPLGVKLTILDPSGVPYSTAQLDTWFTGAVTQTSGLVTFTLKPAVVLPANIGVRIDYTLDWGTGSPATNAQLVRGTVNFPDDSSRSRRVLHNLALSSHGTIHAVLGNQTSGGTYFAIREENGRGTFRLLNRYELYPEHRFTLNQTVTTTYPETLTDNDPLKSLIPAIVLGSGRFANLAFKSGPTVLGDVAYVMAGASVGFVPTSIVMAFDADPEPAEIKFEGLTSGFSLIQPDFARSDTKTQPTAFNTVQSSQVNYEADAGRIRIDNLMTTSRGPVQNALSRSQPVILRRNGQPDVLIEPDRNGSKWNTLLWYTVYHGYQNDSPPLVTGNTVFFASRSALPDIVSGVPFGSWSESGLLSALDADVSPNNAFLKADNTRPWLQQLNHLQFPAPGVFSPNPSLRWPQFTGVTNFTQWRTRLFQTVLDNSNTAFGVVGGDGSLFSWSPAGLFGFNKADFVVVDEGRVARFDPAGNPLWSSDSSVLTSPTVDGGNSNSTKPLVRPTKAYAMNSREYLIVDTGADRIVRMDINGRESRSITGLQLDPTFGAPDGFKTNGPTNLSQPRDVVSYVSFEASPAGFADAKPLEYWVHYLIADTGNKRLIELVDRYEADPVTLRRGDPVLYTANNQRALGVLIWHSPSNLSGKQFDYNSVARVWSEPTAGSGQWVFAAGIGSALPARVDFGLDVPTPTSIRESVAGNGGVVVFDANGSFVINEVTVPGNPADIFWNPTTASWNSPLKNQYQKRIGNVSSVTMRNVIDPNFGQRLAIMFTDDEGVFEIIQPAVASGNLDPTAGWQVRWMITREAFKFMRRDTVTDVPIGFNPTDFRPMYARRLDSGEVLLVNGYLGRRLNGDPVSGEVIQLDGLIDGSGVASSGFWFTKRNFGFNALSIKFELPPIQGARGLVLPVFSDRR
ncbi:MAG: hypothetical protein KF784_02025 [Fimbriimonadaceae bacterium]|nr:hypothetical protein [Fimbriimonadaceae bacterium]